MKKLVLFVVGSFMMMSCGEKEMLPQEVELLKITEQIEYYQNIKDSCSQRRMELEDSIFNHIFTINPNVDSSDARFVAMTDFSVQMESEVAYYWEGVVKEKKREQERLAIVVTALKK